MAVPGEIGVGPGRQGVTIMTCYEVDHKCTQAVRSASAKIIAFERLVLTTSKWLLLDRYRNRRSQTEVLMLDAVNLHNAVLSLGMLCSMIHVGKSILVSRSSEPLSMEWANWVRKGVPS